MTLRLRSRSGTRRGRRTSRTARSSWTTSRCGNTARRHERRGPERRAPYGACSAVVSPRLDYNYEHTYLLRYYCLRLTFYLPACVSAGMSLLGFWAWCCLSVVIAVKLTNNAPGGRSVRTHARTHVLTYIFVSYLQLYLQNLDYRAVASMRRPEALSLPFSSIETDTDIDGRHTQPQRSGLRVCSALVRCLHMRTSKYVRLI